MIIDDVEWRVQYLENLLVKKACLKKVPLHIFYNEKVLLGLTFIKHHIPDLNIVKQGLHVCYQDQAVAWRQPKAEKLRSSRAF